MSKRVIVILLFSLTVLSSAKSTPDTEPLTLLNLARINEAEIAEAESTCGYSSCPTTDDKKINVHVISHTHDDVGWLKTVDQYYYGTKKRFNIVGVQHILDSVIPQLLLDPSKRFVYVEISFFSKWWQEQDDQMKRIVKRLVNEGRLEFINGGWCMNDEANVNYRSTIEQMTLGLKFLNETFGSCGWPRVGWQIDPFGHTNEQASLFAQFGFDGMFFTRISQEDKVMRSKAKALDILWHGDRILAGQSGTIFANIFRDNYDAPDGFCFDVECRDDNLVDNRKSYEYNIELKVNQYVNYLKQYATSKMTNHLLVPFGGDFHFSAAGQNFKNMDKLIKHIRRTAPEFNIFYSTPSCYQYAVNQAVRGYSVNLPEKYDDFMPYDSSSSVWWSGYFSSRPSVKLMEREVANLLQMSRMISLGNLLRNQVGGEQWHAEIKVHEERCLGQLWEVLGDLQHHDAVTGTEKQHVADDYVRRASDAMNQCAKFFGDLRRSKINELLKKSPRYEQLKESGRRFKLDPMFIEDTMFCPQLNISQCDAIDSEVDSRRYLQSVGVKYAPMAATNGSRPRPHEFPVELVTSSVLVSLYNPMARPIGQHELRVPCNGRCDLDKIHVVHVSSNETMRPMRLPVPSGIVTLPFRNSQTNYEILVYANIPALGSTSFVIEDKNIEEIVEEELEEPVDSIVINDDLERSKMSTRSRRIRRESSPRYEYFTMAASSSRVRRDSSFSRQGDRVIVKFDMNTGMIVGLKRVSDGSFLNITQKFGYYFPATSGSSPGAYIFRPNSSEPHMLDRPVTHKLYKRRNGALIEVHQKWSDWIWQTIRIDSKKNYIEFDYVVGPIPVADGKGREVITRYITNMNNNGVFMTDSNGRQLMARQTRSHVQPEDLGGSFYPVVSTLMLRSNPNSSEQYGKSSTEVLAILVDRPQAGSSLREGLLELLIHRRLMRDDGFGVDEALNEPGEDSRGLVTRGKHRLFLKFTENGDKSRRSRPQLIKLPPTPRANLDYERNYHWRPIADSPTLEPSTYLVHDQVYNDLRQESIKMALNPILTFDRLRVPIREFMSMVAHDVSQKVRTDYTLINNTLPTNVHLLTLQPWKSAENTILVRLENTDNPLMIHPFPGASAHRNLLESYKFFSDELVPHGDCSGGLRPQTEVDIEYLIKKIKIVELEELALGANLPLSRKNRLNWTDEPQDDHDCISAPTPSRISLGPRSIRTFLARFEYM